MTETVSRGSPLPLLAEPGERFGWIFQDRNLYRRRFLEPPPTPGVIPYELVRRADMARRQMPRRITISLSVGLGLMIALGCCGAITSGGGEAGALLFSLAFMSLAGGAAGALGAWVVQNYAQSALANAQRDLQQNYERAYASWDARRLDFDRQQQAIVDQLLEWGAATPSAGTRRIDIVGGTSWGWEALLTVFGGSLLSTHGSMTLVDFTGEALCGELASLAEQTGRSVRVTTLPSQLAQLDLAAGLSTQELVDSLVESMYGAGQGLSKADRHQDTMLLTELCEALGERVTVARIAAGLRVLTDRPGQPTLSDEECDRVHDLLPDEARRQAHSNLRRIEGFLRPLESMGSAATELPPTDLTCLIADRGGRSAHRELLKDLVVQWLIWRVSREAVAARSLLVVGADEVHHQQLERLSTLCERRGIRLVLFFEHLREESLHSLGGGEVGFMRLGNHREAQQAAEFIGRQHKFVLSQLTRSLGGNQTHTLADTEGSSETEGRSSGTSRSGLLDVSRQRGLHWSRTRTWSHTESMANGTNWSDAAAAQRVYEFAVEPRVLQDLPDYALLLVKGEGRGSIVQAVECNPEIVTLPRMSMEPLPPMQLPPQHEAAIPVAGPPGQAPLSPPAPVLSAPTSPDQAVAGALPGWVIPAPTPPHQDPYQPPGPGWGQQ